MVITVSLVDFKLSFHFTNLLVNSILFFLLSRNPLFVLFLLETLKSHRIICKWVVNVSSVDSVGDDSSASIAGLLKQSAFQLQFFVVLIGYVKSHKTVVLEGALVVGFDLIADELVQFQCCHVFKVRANR